MGEPEPAGDLELQDYSHMDGMLRDLGDGDIAKGIELIRENQKWLTKQRQRGDRISSAILYFTIAGLVTGALYAFWEGIKAKVLGG